MDTPFILTAIFVACFSLFGLFLLFVRAENIERTALVGGMTLAGALIASAVLYNDARLNFPYGSAVLISVALICLISYGVGRLIDRLLGPRVRASNGHEGTLGADLAD